MEWIYAFKAMLFDFIAQKSTTETTCWKMIMNDWIDNNLMRSLSNLILIVVKWKKQSHFQNNFKLLKIRMLI